MADLDNHKQNMKDLAETRKRKLSDSSGGAGTNNSEYTELKPVTFKEKWDNYWYHYKIATLIGCLVLVFVWATFIEMGKTPVYDAGLAFVTEYPFDSNADFVLSEWKELCEDSNQDGEIHIKSFTAQLDVYNKYSMDVEMAEANVTRFMGNIAVMGNFLYVVDEIGYSSLLEIGCVLADLNYLFDVDSLEDSYRYPLKDTNLAKKVGIGNVLDDLYLCMISYDDLPENRKNNVDITASYTKDFEYLSNLINYN